jgi:hypothetical protein
MIPATPSPPRTVRAHWLLIGLAGAATGIAASWFTLHNEATDRLPIAAIPQYEKFTQRNSCGEERSSYHASLLLRGAAAASDLSRAQALWIEDPALEKPLRLSFIRNGQEITGYRYPALFDGGPHDEQWRPYCEDSDCRFSVIYYVNELAPDAETRRDIRIMLEDGEGKEIAEAGRYRHVILPLDRDKQAAPYTSLDGGLLGDQFRILLTQTRKQDALVTFQIEDADGKREEVQELPYGALGPISISAALNPPVSSAAAFVLNTDWAQQRQYETKLELANSSDPYFSCEAPVSN